MWSLYLRDDNPYPKKLYVATTLRGRLGQEILYALAYAFLLLVLCLSWFIGMTRFWDNVSRCFWSERRYSIAMQYLEIISLRYAICSMS